MNADSKDVKSIVVLRTARDVKSAILTALRMACDKWNSVDLPGFMETLSPQYRCIDQAGIKSKEELRPGYEVQIKSLRKLFVDVERAELFSGDGNTAAVTVIWKTRALLGAPLTQWGYSSVICQQIDGKWISMSEHITEHTKSGPPPATASFADPYDEIRYSNLWQESFYKPLPPNPTEYTWREVYNLLLSRSPASDLVAFQMIHGITWVPTNTGGKTHKTGLVTPFVNLIFQYFAQFWDVTGSIARNDTHSDSTARAHYEKRDALDVATRAMALQQRLTGRMPAAAANAHAEPIGFASGLSAAAASSSTSTAGAVAPHPRSAASSSSSSPSTNPSAGAELPTVASHPPPLTQDSDGEWGAGEDDFDESEDGDEPEDWGGDDLDVASDASASASVDPDSAASPAPGGSDSKEPDTKKRRVTAVNRAPDPSQPVAAIPSPASNSSAAAAAPVADTKTMASLSFASAVFSQTGAVETTASAGAAARVPEDGSKPRGTWTPAMDDVLLRVGNSGPKAAWARTKYSRPDLFGGVSSEQMRWRFRNLSGPNPAQSSRPPRTPKRKHPSTFGGIAAATPQYEYFAPMPAAAGAAAGPPHQFARYFVPMPPTATATHSVFERDIPTAFAAAAGAARIALESISSAKVISGVLYLRAKYRGVADERWIPETEVQTDPVYKAWLK